MKYVDGREVILGDVVLADGEKGTIVAVIDSKQYSKNYPEGWSYLQKGALIEANSFGLLHYPEADEDLVLVSRRLD